MASVLTVDPATLEDVLDSITAIGAATGRASSAGSLVARLRERLARTAAALAGRPRPSVAVVEWTDPLFSAGHWVPDMVVAAGGACALGRPGERSTPITGDTLAGCGAEIIVVAPCGYDLAGACRLAAALIDEGVVPLGVPVWAVDADAAFVGPAPASSTASRRWRRFATRARFRPGLS